MWLPAAYATALGVVGLVAVAAVRDWTPTFFVQGLGGTPLRQLVLGLAGEWLLAGGAAEYSWAEPPKATPS